MKRKAGLHLVILCALLLPASSTVRAQLPAVQFVKPAATGAGSCSSWADACTLATILSGLSPGVEIWVAEGVYKPTTDNLRTATFQLVSGVAIYGGFDGTETGRQQRDWVAHPTILSGDIGLEGDSSDNSHHVVSGSGTDGSAILDGFFITGGNADGTGAEKQGGGMYNIAGSPTLAHVTFADSYAQYGGGMYNGNNSSPALTDVAFLGNSALYGGGMYNSSSSSPTLMNVTFSGDSATNCGGMYNDTDSSPTLTNVTFSDSTSTNPPGCALCNFNGSSPTLTNCILWSRDPAADLVYDDVGDCTINYSDVRGGHPGTGNLNSDPLLVDADGLDDLAGTVDDNLRLQLTSPAIDAGDNSAVPLGVTSDLGGQPRFTDIPTVSDTGSGTPPIVDLGAYEASGLYVVNDRGDLDDYSLGDGLCDADPALAGSQCTLRAALSEWQHSGTDASITFSIGGTISLNSDLPPMTVTTALDIVGPGPSELTIDGGDAFSLITTSAGSSINISGLTLANAHTTAGGAIKNAGSMMLQDVIITGSSADNQGGGIYNSGTLQMISSSVNENSAGTGGGIFNSSVGQVTLHNCTLAHNHAASNGGAISSEGVLLLDGCTVADNLADNSAGGIQNSGSQTLVNSTISGNQANSDGGGILEIATDTTEMRNVTLSGNVADADGDGNGDGGGLANHGGTVRLQNTLLAGNRDGSDALEDQYPDCIHSGEAAFPLAEYNLVGDETGCAGFFLPADGNLVGDASDPLDPRLHRLADNGGPTLTHALVGGSPARDAGSGCEPTDQRGMPRPRDGDADGIAACDIGAYEAGMGNDAWPRAQELILTGSGGLLQASVSEYVDRLGQSRWYRFAVQPGSRVTVKLSDLPADYDLTLYKDIQSAHEALVAPVDDSDLVQLSAEFAPDAYAPDAYAPDAYAPDAYAPDAYAPDAYAPGVFAPDAYAPDAYAPDAYAPDAYAPDAYAPDAYAPDAYAPDAYAPDAYAPDAYAPDEAYSAAQMHSLIGVSAFDGAADESIGVNTWDNEGDFYVRVRGRNSAFDLAAQFLLEVTEEVGVCEGVSSSLPPRSHIPSVTGRQAIILTDLERMGLSGADANAFRSRLEALASSVQGVVVDLGGAEQDQAVAAANSQADSMPDCPYAKNLVARAIKEIVDAYRQQNPLEYVVIVGNDDVIPFFRHPDRALLASEKNYVPPVNDGTPSHASLSLGYVLSQDAYGSSIELSMNNTTLPIPGLAVGRLVETSADIISMLDAYDATGGGVLPKPGSALVTGYDFLADVSHAIESELTTAIGVAPAALIDEREVSPLDETAWTAEDLGALLLGPRHDVIFLAGHFSASGALAADYESRLMTSDLVASEVDLQNALIYSAGCHSGYNTVNEHGIPAVTIEPDWAQAFAKKGATFIGGTGYQYGDTDFIDYSERLYLEFTRQLRCGAQPMAIGQALVAAKLAYLDGMAEIRGIHEKSLLEATLFGLPMLKVSGLSNSGCPADPPGLDPLTLLAYSTDPGAELGLRYADVSVPFSLVEEAKSLTSVDPGRPGTIEAAYLSGTFGVAANPGEPVLPLALWDATVANWVLRGVGFRGGHYTDQEVEMPLTGAAATELRGVHPPFLSSVFFPVRPWRINYFDALAAPGSGLTQLAVTPAQFVSAASGGLGGTLRAFQDMQFRLYYSSSTEAFRKGAIPSLTAPPTIAKVLATEESGEVVFRASVVGDPAAGIQEVWVTYTSCDEVGACDGTWEELPLSQNPQDSTLWEENLTQGPVSAGSIRYMVQAVNGIGLVTLATNLGEYYRVGVDPGKPSYGGDPRAEPLPTELALQSAPGSGAYSTLATFSAVLTSEGAPLPGQVIKFALGGQQRQVVTDASGAGSVDIPLLGSPGGYEVRVSFAGNVDYEPASTAAPFLLEKQGTQLSLACGSATPQYSDDTGVTATLTDVAGRPLRDKSVFFVVDGAAAVSAVTNLVSEAHLGQASWPAGTHQVSAFFSGVIPLPGGSIELSDANYWPSEATASLTVAAEDATVTYTGDTEVLAGSQVNLSALVAQADDGTPGDITLARVFYSIVDANGSVIAEIEQAVDSNGASTAALPAPGAGLYEIQASVAGGYYSSALLTIALNVRAAENTAPEVTAIDVQPDPVQKDVPVVFSASFTDADDGDSHTAVWDWGDGDTCETGLDSDCTLIEPSGSEPGAVSGQHAYAAAGLYTVRLTVEDAAGASGEAAGETVVVYDPGGGLVLGGGWFNSPPGAFRPDPSLEGRATFRVLARYKAASQHPTGRTQFRFRAGRLDFRSTSYEWLVVDQNKATGSGTGTINGRGNYGFLLSVLDARFMSATVKDCFRIKIWDRDEDGALIYDNQVVCGADGDDADPCTRIAAGAVVIHKSRFRR